MTRKEIINALKAFFNLKELVCPEVYNTYGERAWQFFDKDFLFTLLIVRRDILKVGMYVNNWDGWVNEVANGHRYTQRGLRCNLCNEVRSKTIKNQIYMSSHANGAAIDFDADGMTVNQVHEKIRSMAYLLPVRVRMEIGPNVNWNHLDIYDDPLTIDQFTEFKG